MFEVLMLLACAEATCEGGAPDFDDACLVLTATVVEGPEPDEPEIVVDVRGDSTIAEAVGTLDEPVGVWVSARSDLTVWVGVGSPESALYMCTGVETVDLEPFGRLDVTIELVCGVPQA